MVAIPNKISWRHTSIGIVDDNADWRSTLRSICNRLGAIDIVDAANGVMFCAAAENFGRGFDLLLVDDDMTPMDGYMLLRHLRSTPTHPSRRAAAILMAPNTESDTLRKALQVGFHGVLAKPFSAGALTERAERILAAPMLWQQSGDLLVPLSPKQA